MSGKSVTVHVYAAGRKIDTVRRKAKYFSTHMEVAYKGRHYIATPSFEGPNEIRGHVSILVG